jgi:hypothetical protein
MAEKEKIEKMPLSKKLDEAASIAGSIVGTIVLAPVVIVGCITYCIVISPFIAIETIIEIYYYGEGGRPN